MSGFVVDYDGGYTGHGGKYDFAGTVHKGEYVLSQDMIKQLGGMDMVKSLEEIRLGGGNPNQDLMAILAGTNQLHGSHYNGLDYVPFDGYRAELHRGEMVVPKAQSDFLRMGGIVVELQALRSEVSMFRSENTQLSKGILQFSRDSADFLEEMTYAESV